MKKLLFGLSLIFCNTICELQIINFPDPLLKARLLQAGTIGFDWIAYKGWSNLSGVTSFAIDINGDGELTRQAAELITYISVHASGITNMTGIEYFINLKGLDCINNYNLNILNVAALAQLKKLYITKCPAGNIDFSNLTDLIVLDVQYNNKTALDLSLAALLQLVFCDNNCISSLYLSNNVNLLFLSCTNDLINSFNFQNNINLKIILADKNNLTQINTSNLPLLKSLYCDFNQLTALDLSYNPLFKNLSCGNNNLITLKIKNNSQELFGGDFYGTERWNGNPNLNYICADNAEIPALQAYLASSNITQTIIIDSNCVLANDEFVKNEVGAFPNPSSNILNITTNENILSINIYNTLGQMVLENVDYKIDVSGLTAGTYFIKIATETGIVNKKFIKSE